MATYEVVCAFCGVEYISHRSFGKYCSDRCRYQAIDERRRRGTRMRRKKVKIRIDTWDDVDPDISVNLDPIPYFETPKSPPKKRQEQLSLFDFLPRKAAAA